MKLAPHETLLTSQWIVRNGQVVGDETCERIEELVRVHLKQVAVSGWDTLLRDPYDGRLWELTYPQSYMHGGGPTQLRCVTSEEVKKKYDVIVDA